MVSTWKIPSRAAPLDQCYLHFSRAQGREIYSYRKYFVGKGKWRPFLANFAVVVGLIGDGKQEMFMVYLVPLGASLRFGGILSESFVFTSSEDESNFETASNAKGVFETFRVHQ